MQELIEFICLKIEETYYVEKGLEVKCMQKEEELPCNCIPGAMMNQAVFASSMFLALDNISVELEYEDSLLYPAVYYYDSNNKKRLIGAVSKNRIASNLFNKAGRAICSDSADGQLYVSLKRDFKQDEFKKHLREVSQRIDQRKCGQAAGAGKFKLLMLAVKRFRLRNNKGDLHLAFLAFTLFLEPTKIIRILRKEVQKKYEGRQRDILKELLQFLKIYAAFLLGLREEFRKGKDEVFVYSFGQRFGDLWGLYVGSVLDEYSRNGIDIPLEEILTSAMKQNLSMASKFVKCTECFENTFRNARAVITEKEEESAALLSEIQDLETQLSAVKAVYKKIREEERNRIRCF